MTFNLISLKYIIIYLRYQLYYLSLKKPLVKFFILLLYSKIISSKILEKWVNILNIWFWLILYQLKYYNHINKYEWYNFSIFINSTKYNLEKYR